jgi:hypothetical protein
MTRPLQELLLLSSLFRVLAASPPSVNPHQDPAQKRYEALTLVYTPPSERAPTANCSAATVPSGWPACRRKSDWCPLSEEQMAEAPPQLHGALPCQMHEVCHLRRLRMYSRRTVATEARLRHCLANKRVVVLGDSTLLEIATELVGGGRLRFVTWRG